jgi:glutamyl-tRNA synthetase
LIDFAHISRAPAKFDEGELDQLNARLVHDMPFAEAAERLAAQRIGGGEAFWLAVRTNLTKVSEAAAWWRVVAGPVAPSSRTPHSLMRRQAPPAGALGSGKLEAVDRRRQAGDGRKARRFFMPLRQA